MQEPDIRGRQLIRAGWRGWLTLYAVWTLPIFISIGTQLVSGGVSTFAEEPIRFIANQVVFYYLLATICPPIYSLLTRFKFSKRGWPVATTLHLILWLALSGIISTLFGLVRFVTTNSADGGLGQVLSEELLSPAVASRVFIVLVYYVIAAVSMAIIKATRERDLHVRRSQDLELLSSQLQSQLSGARLQTLKYQLQPHFLFNAMNSISSLIESKENNKAYEMVNRLSDLLRTTLELPPDPLVTVRREMQLVDQYLAIERIRFSDRLRVEVDAPDILLDHAVPVLILQPLIENSIHHAISQSVGEGLIRIGVRSDEEQLELTVEDNGPGLTSGWEFEVNAGIGLRNAKARLNGLFPQRHEFSICSVPSGGVRAVIRIPLVSVGGSSGN